jgi:hypothetical protein
MIEQPTLQWFGLLCDQETQTRDKRKGVVRFPKALIPTVLAQ